MRKIFSYGSRTRETINEAAIVIVTAFLAHVGWDAFGLCKTLVTTAIGSVR